METLINTQTDAHVLVCVLGDVGRSPRMQYHALSIARLGRVRQVTLVGYAGEKCIPELEQHPRVRHLRFSPLNLPAFLPSVIRLCVKALHLVPCVCYACVVQSSPHVMLLQNPPCLPGVFAAYLAALFHGTSVCIDWHNLGFTILQQQYGHGHILVRVSKALERIAARTVQFHVCVTEAMEQWLAQNFGVPAIVVRDKPPAQFKPLTLEKRHELLLKMGYTDEKMGWSGGTTPTGSESTIQTVRGIDGQVHLRADRAGIVVSSTSWTPDEDMSILCGALESFDSYLRSQETQLHVCVVVTGKGPLKAAFCEAVGRLQLTNVAVSTPWLEPEDYPAMIASADVGVSLHTSSSGVDLPMKVLDMFGCGVPVCAMEFLALSELVRPRVNGLTFKTAAELCEHLQELFTGFHDSAGSDATLLHTLRRGARRIERWDEQWHRYMQPLVLRMIHVARPRRNTAHTVSVVIVSIVVAFALGLTISWIQST